MSDSIQPTKKISREGIVLIKSFEGFRPRAIRREEGGWVIGYGHTLSAREGAAVSEADAELLLRYDLMPIEKAVNGIGAPALNQHQFDALASFAFSVGLDRFPGSDVVRHIGAGATAEAADALLAWPEPPRPETALRRRAAERALFTADPSQPVALADLLAAPVTMPVLPEPVPAATVQPDPTPAEVAPTPIVETTQTEPVVSEAPSQAEPIGETAVRQDQPLPPSVDPRAAALAALLGEAPAQQVIVEPDVEPTPSPEPVVTSVSDAEVEEVLAALETIGTSESSPVAEPEPLPPPPAVEPAEPSVTAAPETEAASEEAPDTPTTDAPVQPETVAAPAPAPIDPVALAVQRYAPYGAAMIGPLPFLAAARPTSAAQPVATPEVELAAEPARKPEQAPEPVPVATPPVEAAVEAPATEPIVIAFTEPEPVAEVEPAEVPPVWPQTLVPPPAQTVIVPFAPVATIEPLVLTPAEDETPISMVREPWSFQDRDNTFQPAGDGLFGEDLSLTQGGAPIARHGEHEIEAPARFDWSETGAFVIMGAVGLTAFGAAMAAFRLASEQSGGDETTIIAWILAVIGAACVGVSSFNLYRRWGLPGGEG